MAAGPPPFDLEEAKRLIGKALLIGLTYMPEGRQEQIFGIVKNVSIGGIEIRLDGCRTGEIYCLPPDLRSFKPAEPGYYRLRSTGETVVNPDFITTWTVEKN